MSKDVILPPDEQYGIIDTFTPTTPPNVNQVTKILVASLPISGYDENVGDVYDMTQEFEYNNYIIGNSFELEKYSTDEVKVYTGQCDMSGVYIEIQEIINMDMNDADYYLDGVKPVESSVLYIMIKYDPSIEDPNAYIGLIKKDTYLALSGVEKKKYCFIGAVDVTIVGSTVTDSDVYYYDPNSPEQCRLDPKGWVDGGWIDIPDKYLL